MEPEYMPETLKLLFRATCKPLFPSGGEKEGKGQRERSGGQCAGSEGGALEGSGGGGGGGGSEEAEPTAQIRLRCLHQTLREPERATGGWRALASKKINLQCKNNAGRPTLIGPGRQQLTGTACLARLPARLDLSRSLGLFPASVRGGEGAPHGSPPNSPPSLRGCSPSTRTGGLQVPVSGCRPL